MSNQNPFQSGRKRKLSEEPNPNTSLSDDDNSPTKLKRVKLEDDHKATPQQQQQRTPNKPQAIIIDPEIREKTRRELKARLKKAMDIDLNEFLPPKLAPETGPSNGNLDTHEKAQHVNPDSEVSLPSQSEPSATTTKQVEFPAPQLPAILREPAQDISQLPDKEHDDVVELPEHIKSQLWSYLLVGVIVFSYHQFWQFL